MRAPTIRSPALLEAVIDVADQVAGDAVGLDDGQGTLERHGFLMLRGWQMGRAF